MIGKNRLKCAFVCAMIAFMSLGAAVPKASAATAEALPKPGYTLPVVRPRRLVEAFIIPDVYGDGEQVSAVALKYPAEIDSRKLRKGFFEVKDRTITKVTTNTTPSLEADQPGKYVILHLKHTNSVPFKQQAKEKKKSKKNKKDDGAQDKREAPMFSDREKPVLKAIVQQTHKIKAVNGLKYPVMTVPITTSRKTKSILDSFQTLYYEDADVPATIPYNLYLPKGYDPAKKYPMVVFIGDASANTDDDTGALYQGNGGTIWATEKEQQKHPAIVLVPQYRKQLIYQLGMMTKDDHKWTPGLTLVRNLIHHVRDSYAVDKDRIYGTGQSQGGMANIALSDKEPDLFAGQYLVACQWDVDEMAAMKDKNLWIVVCKGDTKAYPGMTAAADKWESLGSKVVRGTWNSHSSPKKFAKLTAQMAPAAPIHLTIFKGGNHMYTWSVAYDIEGIRDWLFEQRKTAKSEE